MILDPRPESDQHRTLTSFTGSPLARAYQVWSTVDVCRLHVHELSGGHHTHRDTHTDAYTYSDTHRHDIVNVTCCAAAVKSFFFCKAASNVGPYGLFWQPALVRCSSMLYLCLLIGRIKMPACLLACFLSQPRFVVYSHDSSITSLQCIPLQAY